MLLCCLHQGREAPLKQDAPGRTQVPLSDRAAQASSSLVQYDKNRKLGRLLTSAGMVISPSCMGIAMPCPHAELGQLMRTVALPLYQQSVSC